MDALFDPVFEPATARVHTGSSATTRLAELGVGQARLHAALESGEIAARQADEFSPVVAAGLQRWIETVRQVRIGLAADGWSVNNERNSPRIIDPSEKLAIVPVRGTADTGIPEGAPKSARKRGDTTTRAIRINKQQLQFNLPGLFPVQPAAPDGDVLTWFLLYYRDTEPDELRAELSLPTRMQDAVVDDWDERIILPPLRFEAEITTDAGGDNDDVDFLIEAY